MEPEKQIISKTGKAIGDFHLVEDQDRILIALSGGKDSWTLLYALYELKKKAPVCFSLFPVTIHPGFPEFDPSPVAQHLKIHFPDLTYHVEHSSITDIIRDSMTPGKSACAFCSRLRRGILYRMARTSGYTKIALGHHADDLIETLLLNQFFNGRIKSMAPLLISDDGKNTIIRPLCYVSENTIAAFAHSRRFPVLSGTCPIKDKKSRRAEIKRLIHRLERDFPGIRHSLISALTRLDTRHLMDDRYWSRNKKGSKTDRT